MRLACYCIIPCILSLGESALIKDRKYLATGPVQMLALELSQDLPNRFSKTVERSAIGATFNVMANLTRLNRDYRTSIITCLANDGHGQFICDQIRQNGVNNSSDTVVLVNDSKLQSAYMCTSISNGLRGNLPVVRRHLDAMSNLTKDKAKQYWDFNKLTSEVSLIHLCLHELALNSDMPMIYQDLINSAKENKTKIVINLNFRKGLYPDETAMERWRDYCISFSKLADILIANQEMVAKDLRLNESENLIKDVASQYQNLEYIALTRRNPNNATYAGSLYCRSKNELSVIQPLPCIVNYPIGSGDAFDAGLIHGIASEWKTEDTLKFAINCARDNLATLGDQLLASELEIAEWLPSHTRT